MPIYLIYLAVFFALPAAILWAVYKKEFSKYKKTILWSLFFVFTLGWFWDWMSYKTEVWKYDSAKTAGVWISGIPIEEFIGFYLFGTLLILSVILTVRKYVSRS